MALLNVNEVAVKKALKPKFNEVDKVWEHGGFVAGKIVGVKVELNQYASGEFANMEAPTLVIEFENFGKGPHATYQERIGVPPSKKYSVQGDKNSTMVDIEEKNTTKSNQDMWKRVKHITDVFAGKPNYRSYEATLSQKQVNEFLDLPNTGTPGDRIKGYTKFFTFVTEFMNGTFIAKKDDLVRGAIYTDKDGASIGVWMVLLPVVAGKGVKYQLPGFMRSGGLIEVIVADTKGMKLPVSLELTDKSVLTLTPKATVASTSTPAGGAPVELSDDYAALL